MTNAATNNTNSPPDSNGNAISDMIAVYHYDDDATVKTIEVDDEGNEVDEELGVDALGTTSRSNVSSTSSTPRSIRARARQQNGNNNLYSEFNEHPMDKYMGCITTRARHQYFLSNKTNHSGIDIGRAVVLINVTNIISLITAMTVFGIYIIRGQHLDRTDTIDTSSGYNYQVGGSSFDGSLADSDDGPREWIIRAWLGLVASLFWSVFGVYGGIFVGRGFRYVGSTMIGVTSIWYCCVCAALLYYLLWWIQNAIVTTQFIIFTSLSVVWSFVCISPHILYFVALRYKLKREQALRDAIERRRQNQNYPTAPSRNADTNRTEEQQLEQGVSAGDSATNNNDGTSATASASAPTNDASASTSTSSNQ